MILPPQTVLFIVATSNVASSQSLVPIQTPIARPPDFNPVTVPGSVAAAGASVFKSFVSFSIELAFFPDFAGNSSSPNTFSDTLLENLKAFQGSKPDIRVGGNTQDYAVFDSSLTTATSGTYIPSISDDYPRILTIGPSFFESYQTWADVLFIHGFNLATNSTSASESLNQSVPYACNALSKNNLLTWEMGNEPDLYKTSAQGIVRPASWSEVDYVKEWKDKVATIKDMLGNACGEDWVSAQKFKWTAPSFAGTNNSLDTVEAWKAGLGSDGDISLFSSHNYIGGATQPGITLGNTLLNHTKTVLSIAAHNAEQKALSAAGMTLPYILGETNSLYNQGAPGLSNSFGAALWGVDFNLMCAATDIQQVFMHQGTDYRYASWQPISTSKTNMGTKPPYYGNIAVAAALGNITNSTTTRVQNIPLSNSDTESAYAIYSDSKLARLMVINLNEYNYSLSAQRPEMAYNFTLPVSCAGHGLVQRLMANGSDATTGITFNGWTYNYDVAKGEPKLSGNVTRDEIVWVGEDGGVAVPVPWSSAALVQLTC
ncbi:glycoside hydrolase family 79 protein [Pleomassaria siparia CBS 279.74]|uniref:Glycoside hydrolase family 79 protein n=1 Tax=Pleomassaria siparia CBS 279.74 TaxID=1314801 RepID=A0A6G1KCH5_9PLEO|nr:glycoside hydrolase family 79 protein [Pleomassaria siparia CBS 279.74]